MKNYIDKRLLSIKVNDGTSNGKSNYPTYIPNGMNIKQLFLVRNIIGKYEGYRFYKEDIEKITDIKSDIFSNIHYLIFIILHEPHLLKIIRKLDVSNKKINEIIEYIEKEITKDREDFYWSKKSIIRLIAIILPDRLYKIQFLKTLLNYIDNDREAAEFLTYYLFSILLDNDNMNYSVMNQNNIKNAIRELYEYTKSKFGIGHALSEDFRQVLNKVEIIPIGDENDVFRASQELEKIYINEETEGVGHNSYNNVFEDLLNNIDDAKNIIRWKELSKQLSIIQKYFQVFDNLLHDCNYLKYQYILTYKEENPFMNSIDIIDSYYNNSSIQSDSTFDKSKIETNLELIREKVFSSYSPCYQLFFKFECPIIFTWMQSYEKFKTKLNNKKILVKTKEDFESSDNDDMSVKIHQQMLVDIFDMFFDNLHHVPDGTNLNYCIDNSKDEVTLIVTQDNPIQTDKIKGLGITRIETIMSFYKGNFEYYNNKEEIGIFKFSLKT